MGLDAIEVGVNIYISKSNHNTMTGAHVNSMYYYKNVTDGECTIHESNFNYNTITYTNPKATNYLDTGVFIYQYHNNIYIDMTLTSVNFMYNEIKSGKASDDSTIDAPHRLDGWIYYTENDKVVMSGCKLNNNTLTISGRIYYDGNNNYIGGIYGAIYARAMSATTCEFKDNTITANTYASGLNGLLYLCGNASVDYKAGLTLTYCEISGNTLSSDCVSIGVAGALIKVASTSYNSFNTDESTADIAITNTTISSNTVTTNKGTTHYGLVYVDGNITFDNCHLDNNSVAIGTDINGTVYIEGGLVHVNRNINTLTLKDTTIRGNSLEVGQYNTGHIYGGLIYGHGIVITNVTMTSNNINAKAETLKGGLICNKTALTDGDNTSRFTLINGTIEISSNIISTINICDGALVYGVEHLEISGTSNEHIKIHDNTINANSARTYLMIRGLIRNSGSTTIEYVDIYNNVFTGDKVSPIMGGAIYLDTNVVTNETLLSNIVIRNNSITGTFTDTDYQPVIQGAMVYCSDSSFSQTYITTDNTVLESIKVYSNSVSAMIADIQGMVKIEGEPTLEDVEIYDNAVTSSIADARTSAGLYVKGQPVFKGKVIIKDNLVGTTQVNMLIETYSYQDTQPAGKVLDTTALDADSKIMITYEGMTDTTKTLAVVGAKDLFTAGIFVVDSERYYLSVSEENNDIYINGRVTAQPATDNDYKYDISHEGFSGGTFSYQWYRKIDTTSTLLTGNTGEKLNLSHIVFGNYYCVVTGSINDTDMFAITSNTITIKPAITAEPSGANQYLFGVDTDKCADNGVNVSYQWYKSEMNPNKLDYTGITEASDDHKASVEGIFGLSANGTYDTDTNVWSTVDGEILALDVTLDAGDKLVISAPYVEGVTSEIYIFDSNNIDFDNLLYCGSSPNTSSCTFVPEDAGTYTIMIAGANDDGAVAYTVSVGLFSTRGAIDSDRITPWETDDIDAQEFDATSAKAVITEIEDDETTDEDESATRLTFDASTIVSISLFAGETLDVTASAGEIMMMLLPENLDIDGLMFYIAGEGEGIYTATVDGTYVLALMGAGAVDVRIAGGGSITAIDSQTYSDLRGNDKADYVCYATYTDTIYNDTMVIKSATVYFDPYYVTYSLGTGATGTVTDSTKYVENSSATVLGIGTATKTGYIFKGWSLNSDGSGTLYQAGNSVNVGSGKTLYAVWAEARTEGEITKKTITEEEKKPAEGTKVEIIDGAIDVNVVIVVEKDNDSDQAETIAQNVKTEVSEKSEIVAKFDIHLEDDNGVKVENIAGNSYRVTLAIPTEIQGRSNYAIVYIADDGSVERYDSTMAGNSIVFETDHFSTWAIVADEVVPSNGGSVVVIILIVLVALILAFVGLFFVWKAEYDKVEGTKSKDKVDRKLKFLDPVYLPINKALFSKKNKANE